MLSPTRPTPCSKRSTRLRAIAFATLIFLIGFGGSCSREEMALVSVAKEHPETRGLARIVEQETRTTVDDDGVERLAQDTTKAQVVGDATVRKLEIPKDGVEAAKDAGKPEKRRRLGYIVVPEADAAQLVRNTDRLSKILNDPELAKLVKEKGY